MSEEVVLFRGSPSLLVKAGTFVVGTVLAIACIVGAIYFFNKQQTAIAIAAAVGAVVVIVYLSVVAALIRTQVFEVTTERVKWRRGIFTKRTDELELYRVMDATLVEPFLLRMGNAGNIEIRCSDASTPMLVLPAVKGAAELREKLRSSVESVRARKGVRVTEFDSGQAPGA
ncbi:MAG TPA: PH domain-containing protein [Verrucomicrobiae bacterium]|nr:PH domain-containing protein [Verrucomicrobiae bacterium]